MLTFDDTMTTWTSEITAILHQVSSCNSTNLLGCVEQCGLIPIDYDHLCTVEQHVNDIIHNTNDINNTIIPYTKLFCRPCDYNNFEYNISLVINGFKKIEGTFLSKISNFKDCNSSLINNVLECSTISNLTMDDLTISCFRRKHHHTEIFNGRKVDWSFLFVVVFIAAGGLGNILVCLAVCLDRRLHNVTNYFLLSLAVADLLVSLFVMPLGAIPGLLVILLFIIASTCLGLSHGINEVESKILANSVNKMSIDFFKVALNNEADNFICSPFSVANVLAMSAFGSNSETRDEIIKVLHMKNYYKVIEKLHNKMSLNGSFDLIMNTDSLKIKNKMYVNENINIKSSFLNSIKNIFKSDVKSLDFNDSTNAANEINNWIEKETNNNIKDLVTNNDFDEDTALALINAVYFKGNWKYLFEINDTVSELFHVNKTFSKKIPTMKQTVSVNYNELPDLDAKLVELPYEMPKEAGDMSMFIIVPNKIDGIKKIEENISKINLQTLLNTYKEKVEISLPKFKIETKINLKDYLKKMGINKAFTDEADFSGIADDKKLFISKILQKAFIEVNEEGTEAAAATNAIMQSRMLSGEFINANRPFIVILATRKVIVFIGRINDPTLI